MGCTDILCSRAALLGLRSLADLSGYIRVADNPVRMLLLWSQRGGVKERARSCFKLPLSSIVLGNAKSIRNKADELEACTCFLCRFKRADLIPGRLSKMWLIGKDHDPTLPGLNLVRLLPKQEHRGCQDNDTPTNP